MIAGTSASASINYGDFTGTTVTYTDVIESSGDVLEAPEPLYGAPSGITGDLLDFDPTTFFADAPPTDITDGSLSFSLVSNGGLLTALIVSESGIYEFTGIDNDELVAATLQVQILDPLTNLELASQQSAFSLQYSTAPAESGVWSNTVTIDLTPFAATQVDVVINNVLFTTGVGPGTALISKTDFKVNTPEPAAALMLGGLAAAMLRRRTA